MKKSNINNREEFVENIVVSELSDENRDEKIITLEVADADAETPEESREEESVQKEADKKESDTKKTEKKEPKKEQADIRVWKKMLYKRALESPLLKELALIYIVHEDAEDLHKVIKRYIKKHASAHDKLHAELCAEKELYKGDEQGVLMVLAVILGIAQLMLAFVMNTTYIPVLIALFMLFVILVLFICMISVRNIANRRMIEFVLCIITQIKKSKK